MDEARIPVRFSEKKTQVQIFEIEPHGGLPSLMNKINTWLSINAHRITVHNVQFVPTLDKYIAFVWYGEKFQTDMKETE